MVLRPDGAWRILSVSVPARAPNSCSAPYETFLTETVEFIGYIGRALSASQTPDWTLGPYIMQSVLLLVAPALFAASIYMYLGRLIVLVRGEKFSVIRVGWMTKIFVAGDVLSFLMQSLGMIRMHARAG